MCTSTVFIQEIIIFYIFGYKILVTEIINDKQILFIYNILFSVETYLNIFFFEK